ncbi:MAG: hypothetical protein WCE21_05345 [Candidatus Babeliales bacterium]
MHIVFFLLLCITQSLFGMEQEPNNAIVLALPVALCRYAFIRDWYEDIHLTQIAHKMMQREETVALLQNPALLDTQFVLTEDQKKIVAQKISDRTWYHAFTIGKKEGGHTKQVNKVLWTPDGTHLISCSNDKTVKLFDINTQRCEHTWAHTNEGFDKEVFSVSISNDGKLMVAGAKDSMCIKLYDVTTRACIRTLVENGKGVGGITFSDDNKQLIVTSDDWVETIYSVPDLRPLSASHAIDPYTYTGINWTDASSDRKYSCLRSRDTLFIYGCKEKWPLAYYYSSDNSDVTSAYFSPNSRFIATSWADHTIKLFTHANLENIIQALECLKHAREDERGSASSLICKKLSQYDEQ